MKGGFMPKSPHLPLLVACSLCVFHLLGLVERSHAQNTTTNATTDPSEVRALNSIFGKWSRSASSEWNISGEPCSGIAIDSTTFNRLDFNPGIKCDCSFNASTVCHITQMKVSGLQVSGEIPEELRNLTFLTNLNLAQNYLTGPLPAFIGNLTALQYLSVSMNALSGNIPKELGKLQNLISLAFSSNDFSGSLPPELGNLTKLEEIFIDSAGLSGEIPSTFAKLQNLKTVWASDNNITGKIPDFIGSWTNLSTLSLQGNSFEGPIPSSFANLTALTDLRLSDVSNASSTLDFVKDMKGLSTLVLRNNTLSGTIPSSIGDLTALKQLDLSVNNLSGEIPEPLFNIDSLSYLFLGNNNLSGTLPLKKSSSLTAIDLSYNQLTGTFPSWVRSQGLQLNLVANNFIFDSSNSSILPSGLDCLQRSFPCGRSSPLYSSFAINCGGDTLRTSDSNYERDNETLGAASYYVTNTKNWAVSSIGRYLEGTNVEYTRFTLAVFSSTENMQLFQSTRLSPVSLRYYGLGLHNGNYTVSLQFADTDFPDTATWQSGGRRVFDIYLQESLQVKDFDIKKDAGGVTRRAVQKILKAHVSENFLEIHLLWAGKGTCCIPTPGTYGPAISAIKVTSDFEPPISPSVTSTKKNKTGLIVGITVSVGAVGVISIFIFSIWRQRSRRSSIDEDEEFLGMDSRPNTFNFGELKTATEAFSPANKLGQGGFGPVYKGTLPDGRMVAVKQLSVASHQGKNQFVAEIAIISAVQHRNLVKLYGCCIDGDKRLLVYEYLENKSLDQALFGKSNLHLNWSTRFDICLGTARGLAYLHEESRPRIVHRDVKASNILLDADLSPKISDFGLAKLYDDKVTHISTHVAGTIGYLAPEYAMRGHLTEKADVFGFGVVILEIVSGRPNSSSSIEPEKMYLVEWAWHLYENNRALELVDPTLSEFNEGQVIRMIRVALLCIQASPTLRPPMSRVIAMLLGDIEVSAITSKPGYLTDLPFRDASSFMSDYTSGASTSINTNSQIALSSNASTVTHLESSPVNSSGPLLHEIIGEGR